MNSTESAGSYGEYSIDDEDQLQQEDTLVDRGLDDVLDEGYSPLERPVGLDSADTLDERLAEEEPDVADTDGGSAASDENLMSDEQVGDARVGRLTASGNDAGDDETYLARDVGIDGAAASAEEAAVHEIDE